ncbi:hypothetical protein PTTG_28384 [Puccinia triticina 1-1 BBBD Race 1]|uniref:HECT-type E3 ubiquitin transferase n=1 Tax=Puccinia triticina (isolate 1-1 / race 1 (BBBD)) TaxID=630390 RepID=A0A180GC49_PUCT1|nr:hypothetical protein PTTG_28384 [Puccinia triticina 1-1 BBBD Race 1]
MLDIDMDDWIKHTNYRGYQPDEQVIKWFWQASAPGLPRKNPACSISPLLGTSRIPVNGFQDLQGSDGPRRFTIKKAGEITQLPKSHTCFSRFDLPRYPTSNKDSRSSDTATTVPVPDDGLPHGSPTRAPLASGCQSEGAEIALVVVLLAAAEQFAEPDSPGPSSVPPGTDLGASVPSPAPDTPLDVIKSVFKTCEIPSPLILATWQSLALTGKLIGMAFRWVCSTLIPKPSCEEDAIVFGYVHFIPLLGLPSQLTASSSSDGKKNTKLDLPRPTPFMPVKENFSRVSASEHAQPLILPTIPKNSPLPATTQNTTVHL